MNRVALWKVLSFWWLVFLPALLFSANLRAQLVTSCGGVDVFDTQQEALSCCLSLAATNDGATQVTTFQTCNWEFRITEACLFQTVGGQNRFRSFAERRDIQCSGAPRPWGSVGQYDIWFLSCEADLQGGFNSSSDLTGTTVCLDGCVADTIGCAGFGADFFCEAVTTGEVCENSFEGESTTDQCDRDPTRPECQCPATEGGVMSPTCLCQADPLIFGDVSVCDDLLGGDGGTDPNAPGQDSDGDGNPDRTDPCPLNPSPTCEGGSNPGGGDDPNDVDGDGIPDATDPCPNNPDPSCSGGSSGGAGGSGGSQGANEGQGSGVAGDINCSTAPTCDRLGDDECSLLVQHWQQYCDLYGELTPQELEAIGLSPEFRPGGSAMSEELMRQEAIFDQDGDFLFVRTPESEDLALDQSGFGLNSACPGDINVAVAGTSFSIPFTPICDLFSAIGALMVSASLIAGARIVAGGV